MRYKVLMLMILTVGLSHCKKIDKLTQFSLTYSTQVGIPPSTVVSVPLDILTPEVETNAESKFSLENTHSDLLEKVSLTALKLTLNSPPNGDFSFLNEVRIFIQADGLNDTEVASAVNIPNTIGNTLELQTTDADLKEYIKKEEFKLKVKVVTDEVITQQHIVGINCSFFVDAKILGQ